MGQTHRAVRIGDESIINDRINVYQTSPNQKIIMTKKCDADSTHPYGILNKEAAFTASRVLSDRAYKLYVRMAINQNEYVYGLSPKGIYSEIGMSEKKYRSAVKELINKGYLVKDEKRNNFYCFYEAPKIVLNNQNLIDDSELSILSNQEENTPQMVQMNRPYGIDDLSITGREIIHDITNNTHNNRLNIISVSNPNRIKDNRKALLRNYQVWLNRLSNQYVERILENYKQSVNESFLEKYLGNRYGRFICGWNRIKNQPIIVYGTSYNNDRSLIHHDISDIPLDYYLSPSEIENYKEEEAFREYLSERHDESESYDYDELPF